MYYKLSSDMGGEPNTRLVELNNEIAQIRRGRLIADLKAAYIMELPFRFNLDVQTNEDGSRQEPRLSAYYFASEVMRKDLVEALKRAGVDNLQVFPAVITEEGRDTHIEDYVVVNVVGLVKCASVRKSDAMPFAGAHFFMNLVIDSAKTMGFPMFRLADSMMDILVHESVAKELKKHSFPHLELTPLREV